MLWSMSAMPTAESREPPVLRPPGSRPEDDGVILIEREQALAWPAEPSTSRA